MDFSTTADITKAKDLAAAITKATVGTGCLASVVKTGSGPAVKITNRFIDRRTVASVADALAFVADAAAAKAAGVLPRELRVVGDGPPAWLAGVKPPAKLPARFASVLPKGHPLRP